jgi:hypothetical protein
MAPAYYTTKVADPGLPLPYTDPVSKKDKVITDFFINTKLGLETAVGHLHRNGPPPTVSSAFYQMLQKASHSIEVEKQKEIDPKLINKTQRLNVMLGEKGCGKTSTAITVGYLIDGIAPELFACENRSLDDLMWEPIFTDTNKSDFSIIKERIEAGTINPISIRALREIPNLIQETNGKISLDETALQEGNLKDTMQAYQNVLQIEGLEQKSHGIGIDYVEGPMIRTFKAAIQAARTGKDLPCKIVIDEIDKRMENTGSALQQFWLFLQGSIDELTTHKNGKSFTFKRSEMPANFAVYVTGNTATDMGNSLGFSESQLDRLQPINFSAPTEGDIAFRIQQELCGIPLELHKTIGNYENFANVLLTLRKLGVEAKTPEDQSIAILQYKDTIQASRQLAKFYKAWETLIDPETIAGDPLLERTLNAQKRPGPRLAQQHLREARDPLVFAETPDVAKPTQEIQSLLNSMKTATATTLDQDFGTKLEAIIQRDIYNMQCLDNTRKKLLKAAQMNGIIPSKDEENNPNPNVKLISELLSRKEATYQIKPETQILQKELFKIFQKETGNTQLKIDDVLPLRDLQGAINQLEKEKAAKTQNNLTYILNINPKYLGSNKKEKPIQIMPVFDIAVPSAREAVIKIVQNNPNSWKELLIHSESFISLLKTPVIGTLTMDAFWNETTKDQARRVEDVSDRTREILEGRTNAPRLTSLLVNHKGTAEKLMLINIGKTTCILGNKIETHIEPPQKEEKELTVHSFNIKDIDKLEEQIDALLENDKDAKCLLNTLVAPDDALGTTGDFKDILTKELAKTNQIKNFPYQTEVKGLTI